MVHDLFDGVHLWATAVARACLLLLLCVCVFFGQAATDRGSHIPPPAGCHFSGCTTSQSGVCAEVESPPYQLLFFIAVSNLRPRCQRFLSQPSETPKTAVGVCILVHGR